MSLAHKMVLKNIFTLELVLHYVANISVRTIDMEVGLGPLTIEYSSIQI